MIDDLNEIEEFDSCYDESNVEQKVYTVEDFFEYDNVDRTKPIVYIIMCGDDYGEGGGTIDKVFKDPEVAIKYCNRKNELEKDSCYYFYPTCENFSDDIVDNESPLIQYYSFTCELGVENPEDAYFNYPEETELKIYKGDVYVEEHGFNTSYTVYSINSFEEAKEEALKIWKYGFEIQTEYGNKYWDGYGKVCPICGNKIKHPYTGEVTIEQIEEDSNCCMWSEVIDEGRSTLGYLPQCRKDVK